MLTLSADAHHQPLAPNLDVIQLRMLSGLGSYSTRRLRLARGQPSVASHRGGFSLGLSILGRSTLRDS